MRKTTLCLLIFISLSAWASPAHARKAVGGVARIQPEGGVICLSGPPGATIAAINVREGEFVKKGVSLVIFQGNVSARHEVKLAELAMKEAVELGPGKIKFEGLKMESSRESGSKAIGLQELKVARARSDAAYAERRRKRFDKVGGEDLSAEETDRRNNQARCTKLLLDIATLELQRMKLDYDYEIKLAAQRMDNLVLGQEIRSKRAMEQLQLARAKLAQSMIVAPIDGTIIEVDRRVGERTGDAGTCVKMAKLDQMYADAKIYESDIPRLKVGDKAQISGDALASPIAGVVESIGRIITDTSKIAHVKVRLDDPKQVSSLINMEVNVMITP